MRPLLASPSDTTPGNQPPGSALAAQITSLLPADSLRQGIIVPTLSWLGITEHGADSLLLGTLLACASLPADKRPAGAIGPFAITPECHLSLWDDYLAQDPDLASRVRGLASQRGFLQDPHAELGFNLGYASAIAWLIYQRQAICLNGHTDLRGLARLWQTAYPHQGGRASDFLAAWRRAFNNEGSISA